MPDSVTRTMHYIALNQYINIHSPTKVQHQMLAVIAIYSCVHVADHYSDLIYVGMVKYILTGSTLSRTSYSSFRIPMTIYVSKSMCNKQWYDKRINLSTTGIQRSFSISPMTKQMVAIFYDRHNSIWSIVRQIPLKFQTNLVRLCLCLARELLGDLYGESKMPCRLQMKHWKGFVRWQL